MQAKELKSLTSEELMNKLNDFKSELFSLRFQLATGQLENTARIIDKIMVVIPPKILNNNELTFTPLEARFKFTKHKINAIQARRSPRPHLKKQSGIARIDKTIAR